MREKEVLEYKLLKADTANALSHDVNMLFKTTGSALWEPQGAAVVIAEVNEDGTTKLSFFQTMFRYNEA